MKEVTYTVAIVAVLAAVFLAMFYRVPPVQPGVPIPYSGDSAVRGMLSSGTITSVEWGDPNIVTVPDSWFDLRESARESYLFAVWDASGNKCDVHIVDESGRVHIYRPSTEPVRDYDPQR